MLKKTIFFILIIVANNSLFAQYNIKISVVPEVQYGYSWLGVRDNREKPYTTEGGDYKQINFGLNIPYSKNLTLKASFLANNRSTILKLKTNPDDNFIYRINTNVTNLGFDFGLFYTDYFKKNRALYFGLGYFYNYSIAGRARSVYTDEISSFEFYNIKNKELFEGSDALFDRKNQGVYIKFAYKNKWNLYYSVFYNLGVDNIQPNLLTKFTSIHTNDVGISLGYFLKSD